MSVQLKRCYDAAEKNDGYRVLVDKMWPRGVSKDDLNADDWLKDIAPSDSLRNDFHDNRIDWKAFHNRYMTELSDHKDTLKTLATKSKKQTVTLLYSSKDEKHNNALVLAEYLKKLT